MNHYTGKAIGIWGYGIVGKSAISYLQQYNCTLSLYDHKSLDDIERKVLTAQSVTLYEPDKLEDFLAHHTYILPSPGIDLRPYKNSHHIWLSEFDLLQEQIKNFTIGITGTLGKTTITHTISELLERSGKRVTTGGNIGTAMLDFSEKKADYTVIELSSFQLELATKTPDLAIITNIYPNHLDRHDSFDDYRHAKYKIVINQQAYQQALIPLEELAHIQSMDAHQRLYSCFLDHEPTWSEQIMVKDQRLYYLHRSGAVIRYEKQQHTMIIDQLPQSSYPINWLIICASLDILQVDSKLVSDHSDNIRIPEHRLTCLGAHRGIKFYNDSKSTVVQATLAAVKKLEGNSTVLFIGGLSKGVDRLEVIQKLASYQIKHILCFGKEAQLLYEHCITAGIKASAHKTLEEAFQTCIDTIAQSGDTILFSPAGASFDLFTNFETRGQQFTQLVQEFMRS